MSFQPELRPLRRLLPCTGVMVTRTSGTDSDGYLTARPVDFKACLSDGRLLFRAAADEDSQARLELEREPRVLVTFGGEDRFIAVSGRARVVRGLPLRESPALPLGAQPNSWIEVTPERARSWDRSGGRSDQIEFAR